MEKDSPLVLDLRLTPLKSGELSIDGIEYSLKAVFPQSESTDYTIKGKQPLVVQGPRLNSTKEQKSSKTPLYMKDSRLTCKIVSKQPRLKLSSFNIPETMYEGEVQVVDVQFENVGNASMSKMYLIHHSPGMFSFGGTSHQAKRKDTLFDLPLHSGLFCLKIYRILSLKSYYGHLRSEI